MKATNLTGATVIVTGGTRGVGRGISEAFLAAGAHVVVCGRNAPDKLPAVDGREVVFVQADVRDPDQIAGVVDAAWAIDGRIDVLVNNAGGAPFALAADTSPRFSEKIVALNLLAPLWFAQAVYGRMRDQGRPGSIVNIASVSGTRPSPGTAAYGAAKAGLINLTRSLAVEWAPDVRVNAIVAGMILTEQAHLHYGDDDGIAAVARTIPMQRLATPADIANACLFLASDAAAYITGAALEVHGGGERPAFLDAANVNQ
ncbi:MAG: SDR family oxidoreductase [Candidatus Dadabacteria bacterium]|nr:MAG: SDR family oxidoreductase [Candidatus Dadabacteria bacterium]